MIVNRDNEVNYVLPSDNKLFGMIMLPPCTQLFYMPCLSSCSIGGRDDNKKGHCSLQGAYFPRQCNNDTIGYIMILYNNM